MKKFLTKLAFFSIPGVTIIAALLISYVYYDPFKVIRKYPDYSYPFVITNRDYISTEMFIKNYSKYHYNSFIFGSSRTMGFKMASWHRFLPPDAVTFMFDASAESVYGIDIKLKFLDSMHIKMNNVIFVFDRDVTFKTAENSSEHLYIKHPLLSGQNMLAFQATFFKAYLSMKFLRHFYEYEFTGKYKTNMTGFIEFRKIRYDTVTNEQKILDQEKEIAENPVGYYERRRHLFYDRPSERTDSSERIKKPHLQMLQEIKKILEKNNTNYKIILCPLYEQIKFNKKDLAILQQVFPGHLYDFTGKNEFTDKITNYYETAHFRTVVGDSILEIVYKHPAIQSNNTK
jgi:hypothetical protein